MDGKIQYELTLEAQKALDSVKLLESSVNKTADVMQKALNKASADASLSKEIQKVDSNLKDATKSADKFNDKIAAGNAKFRQMSLLIGGMAIDIGSSALKAYGHDKSSAYLSSMATSGLQFGLLGGQVGGPWGAAVGAGLGAVSGGAKEFFNQKYDGTRQQQREMAEHNDRLDRDAKDRQRQIIDAQIEVNKARRDILRMDSSKELITAIAQIDDQIAELQDKTKFGLIDDQVAAKSLRLLQDLKKETEDFVNSFAKSEEVVKQYRTIMESAQKGNEAAAQANRNRMVRENILYDVAGMRESADYEQSLSNAKSSEEKIRLIDGRNTILNERIKEIERFMNSKAWNSADEKTLGSAASTYSSSWSELIANRSRMSDLLVAPARPSLSAGTLDSLGASGGYMRGSAALRDSAALSSATTDLSRQTARNTGEMVTLLRQIAGKRGATWQRR